MNKKAFTLIELLVVVLIICILAAIALPQYKKAVMKTKYATLKNMTRGIADAQKIYYLANNEYADSFADLGFYGTGATDKNFNQSVQHFKWGVCLLEVPQRTSPYVYCKNDAINMSYLFVLNSRRAVCVAYGADTNALNHQLCKAETNAEPTYGWYYYN